MQASADNSSGMLRQIGSFAVYGVSAVIALSLPAIATASRLCRSSCARCQRTAARAATADPMVGQSCSRTTGISVFTARHTRARCGLAAAPRPYGSGWSACVGRAYRRNGHTRWAPRPTASRSLAAPVVDRRLASPTYCLSETYQPSDGFKIRRDCGLLLSLHVRQPPPSPQSPKHTRDRRRSSTFHNGSPRVNSGEG